MPTYEYLCEACGHELEVFQSMTEASKRKCPECGRSKLRRKVGVGGGILFKGKGFYQTDYRSESYKQGEAAEKKADAPAPAKKSDTSSTSGTSGKSGKSGKSGSNAD